jgi:hypothetical protein
MVSEYLIEYHKRFLCAPHFVIHITAKGLSESMAAEIANLNVVFVFPLFQILIDILARIDLICLIIYKNVLVYVWSF